MVHLAAENISRLGLRRPGGQPPRILHREIVALPGHGTRLLSTPPTELGDHPALRQEYEATCRHLFDVYQSSLTPAWNTCAASTGSAAERATPPTGFASAGLPPTDAAPCCRRPRLTNVGVTANARTLEHAISKLMSSELEEERQLGTAIREQGRAVTPTPDQVRGRGGILGAPAAGAKGACGLAGTIPP